MTKKKPIEKFETSDLIAELKARDVDLSEFAPEAPGLDEVSTDSLLEELRDRGAGMAGFTDEIARAFDNLKRGNLSAARHHLSVLHREFCEPHT